MIISSIIAILLTNAYQLFDIILMFGAGTGSIFILRWFWWRINAWSEITALATSIVITISFEIIAYFQTINNNLEYSLFGSAPSIFGMSLQVHHKLMIIVPIAIIAWVTVTFFTEPEPMTKLESFYKRVQPGGWWGPVTSSFDHTLQPVTKGIFILWLAGVMMIYGFTFGIGNLIFQNYSASVILFGFAGIGAYLIWNRNISKLT